MKYLHSINGMPKQSTYDPEAHWTPDTWWFNRKVNESKLGVTYELTSVFDLEGLAIPREGCIAISVPLIIEDRSVGTQGLRYLTQMYVLRRLMHAVKVWEQPAFWWVPCRYR